MLAVVQVLQAEQMPAFQQYLFLGHLSPFFGVEGGHGHQIPRQSAWLRAGPAVGAPVADVFAQVTLSAVTDAQRAMHKELQRHRGFCTDLAYFVNAQLTAQHHLAETQPLQFLHPLHREVVALGAGMEVDGGQVEAQQVEVLDDEGINPRLPALPGDLPGLLHLLLTEQGVQGDIHLGVELRRVAAQRLDVTNGVGGLLPGPEGGTPDIHRVGPMVDGGHAH